MKDAFNTLETSLEEYLLKRAPRLPKEIQEIIVTFGPWILAAYLIVIIPLLIAGFEATFRGSLASALDIYSLKWIFQTVTTFLIIISLPGLFKKEAKSWRFVFYAGFTKIVASLFMWGLASAIIEFLLVMYILFQIKSYYK